MSHLFNHARACTEWKNPRFALKQKLSPGRSLLGKRSAKPITNFAIAGIDLQLPGAIPENKRSGIGQLDFKRVEYENEQHIVVLRDASQQMARFVVAAEPVANDADETIVLGETRTLPQNFVKYRGVRSNSGID